jgi:hypothetical protein
MNVVFLSVAVMELTDAVAYYNQQSEGLGLATNLPSRCKRPWTASQSFPMLGLLCPNGLVVADCAVFLME